MNYKLCFYTSFRLVILLGLLHLNAFSQKILSIDEAKEDIKFLVTKLQKRHPGLYFYTDSLAYHEMLRNTESKITSEISSQDLYLKICPLITEIKDLHTSLSPAKIDKKQKTILLPLILREFDNAFYVHFNGSLDSNITRTDELLSINQKPTSLIFNEISSLFGNDNSNNSSQRFYGTRLFANYYQRIYGNQDSLLLRFRNIKSDSVYTRKVRCLEQKEILKQISKRYKNTAKINFNYKVLDSLQKSAVLEISSFTLKANRFDIFQVGFKRKLNQRFKQIAKDSIQNLAIDFRANGGGFIPNIYRVMKFIAVKEFKLTDTTIFKKNSFNKIFPIWGVSLPIFGLLNYKKEGEVYVKRYHHTFKPNTVNHYSNNLYFLIDGGSYSATTFTLALAKDQNLGPFIGTRAAGAGWGSFAGTWDNFKLPNSKIKVHMPLLKLSHSLPNNQNKSFFLEPDYEVNQSFEDFLVRKDSVLDFFKNVSKSH